MVQRFWVYQCGRFPLLRHSVLVAIITLSGVDFSVLARHRDYTAQYAPEQMWSLSALVSMLVAFVSAFAFIFQLQVAYAYRHDGEDIRVRSYCTKLRGTVSLRELATVAIVLMLLQLGLALWLNAWLLLPLLLVWSYLWLISKGFFVYGWLKAHPIVHLFVRGMVAPLIFFYITACDWSLVRSPPPGLAWFLMAGFFSGLILEIGCKIRAPQDEMVGVETYSKLWGRRTAVTTWLFVMLLMGISATRVALSIHAGALALALPITLLTVAVLIGDRFLQNPSTAYASSLKKFSTIYPLVLYLSLLLLPLFIR